MAAIPVGTALLAASVLTAGTAIATSAMNKPKAMAPLKVPTRNMAADNARAEDALRRRRGAGANELTGGGAEARTAGGKTLLGQ